jgi:ABC-type uncharacterized transport system involved in gliding motility auxiliary subunit
VKRRLGLAGVLAVLKAANVVARGHNAEADLSASRRFTLSPETRALVRAVRAPLRITAFLSEHGGVADDARFLLARYHELNSRITAHVVDPDAHPGQARAFGITQYATVVLQYRGQRVDAPDAEELEISTGILRLLRGHVRTICVLTGHGEPSLDDTSPNGLSQVADLLRHNAYDPRTLDLTTAGPGAKVPSDCAAVLIVGPIDPMLPTELDALQAYARDAGRLMVLATPESKQEADPNPLLAPWGVRFTGGVVVDPARSENLDPVNVIIESFPSVSPVDAGLSRLQFPAGGGLLVDIPPNRPGLTVARVAVASDQSFVETRPDVEFQRDDLDIPGPVLVAAAADDSRVVNGPTGAHIARTRLFVAGDSIWATNQALGNLSNGRLFVNAVNWLAEEEQLLATTSRPNQARPLPLTAERQTKILVTTVGVVPGAIVGVGLLAALGRRRRARVG